LNQPTTAVHKIVRDLLLVGVFLQKTGNRITRALGLTQQQFTVLYEIGRNDSVNQKHLVGALLLEKSNVSKIVNALQSQELIRITVSPDDARATWLSITAEGKKMVNDCMKALHAWNTMWLEPLDEKEIVSAEKILGRLKGLMRTL
jgi:DNA-binding MarR family transcriptional regulator